MCLCFSEVIVFYIFAKISEYIGENIFAVIFAMSIVAMFIINRKLNKILSKKEETKNQEKIIKNEILVNS